MDLLRSLPLGLYLEQPITWLHRLDPRVKLGWLMSFLLAPILANPYWRLALVAVLMVMTLTAGIPWRVWRQQMGWLLMLGVFLFAIAAIAPDALNSSHQPRLPADDIPVPPTSYQYVLWKLDAGFLKFTVTRRTLALAISASTLLFTLIYSSTLYLLTTAPEEITAGIESLMRPLRRFKIPVTEIALTLTLSLRFIPLVLEEVQNLVRSVRTRAINWKKLGVRKSLQVWLLVVDRLLENLLLRAEQIASAMKVRGFTSPNEHRVQWYQLRIGKWDWMALFVLGAFWSARLIWGGEF
ncbi:MAG: CbiQ family ECF transporter T component [Cyanosarcina radialis HA8281-LM2]|jgi:energy-coupling factor transport system permease protein|nr:CbiQ family ECF transporter T component [Cyanosarcina radialis HA8281-LM2]